MEITFKDSKIIFDKELNELDKFVLKFIGLLEKHTSYIIVSGYVAILFGRTRATDDIDITIPKLGKEKFSGFFNDVLGNGYWFLNSDEIDELYDLLEKRHSVRVALHGRATPNFEIRFARSESDFESFKNRIKVSLHNQIIYIAPPELQIAYKEVMLTSNKDREDALHLREVFKENLDNALLQSYIKFLKRKKEHGEY